MATMPPEVQAIESEDWARIWVHAWLDPEFRKRLERDPKAAAEEFNRVVASSDIPRLKYDKAFDVVEYIFGKRFTVGTFVGKSFTTISDQGLAEIAAKGTLNSAPFCLQPSEWEPLD